MNIKSRCQGQFVASNTSVISKYKPSLTPCSLYCGKHCNPSQPVTVARKHNILQFLDIVCED